MYQRFDRLEITSMRMAAGFESIQPAQGLSALQRAISSSAWTATNRVIGNLRWQSLLTAPARRTNPFFEDLISAPLLAEQVKSRTQLPQAAQSAALDNDQLLQALTSIVMEVVGRKVAAEQPLMEVRHSLSAFCQHWCGRSCKIAFVKLQLHGLLLHLSLSQGYNSKA